MIGIFKRETVKADYGKSLADIKSLFSTTLQQVETLKATIGEELQENVQAIEAIKERNEQIQKVASDATKFINNLKGLLE